MGSVLYDVACLICALFVLEKGADVFVDHTAIVAKMTGIPQSAVALLTAGAEWEELAVVVACIAKGRSSLAIGNVVGSSIANIIGAFSLGLIFYDKKTSPGTDTFERSSVIYTVTLLVITTAVAVVLAFGERIRTKPIGGLFIGLFGVYVLSISYLISKGITRAPELSDSDAGSDTTTTSGGGELDVGDAERDEPEYGAVYETTPIMQRPTSLRSVNLRQHDRENLLRSHPLIRHVSLLLVGVLCIIISGYVLSEAVANLVDETGISDGLGGVVILSIATTIPEKLVAVLSGTRGHCDIMLANTVGSNTFLLTLCIGIIWLAADSKGVSVTTAEIVIMFASAVSLAATLLLPVSLYRLLGIAMLVGYIAFVVLEFTTIHRM